MYNYSNLDAPSTVQNVCYLRYVKLFKNIPTIFEKQLLFPNTCIDHPLALTIKYGTSYLKYNMRLTLSILSISLPSQACPSWYNYDPGNTKCYKYHENAGNWDSANRTCTNKTGHMPKINSEADNTFVQNKV